ncbi:hypothetical protein IMZ31_21000 (plasmid) [Pontibacillus sp. ALD_SL1]|uniref:hypothetical protein n=1 Tax=Pontibacillus sp. ALD_SL1 TaxID=2777185 RepID=UPI001A978248|nr:hypothetical protein [Pontibacillus sp. ALD_SL1]QST03028.1 hypothetical protein IMZ31_21000 [Pontibacillus sp. ALD_SL1]
MDNKRVESYYEALLTAIKDEDTQQFQCLLEKRKKWLEENRDQMAFCMEKDRALMQLLNQKQRHIGEDLDHIHSKKHLHQTYNQF